ncbi:MAG: hypothetical protein ACRDO8_03825, partial [Nocardioidaceae bacterium]
TIPAIVCPCRDRGECKTAEPARRPECGRRLSDQRISYDTAASGITNFLSELRRIRESSVEPELDHVAVGTSIVNNPIDQELRAGKAASLDRATGHFVDPASGSE